MSLIILFVLLLISGAASALGLVGGFFFPFPLIAALFFGLLFSVWLGVGEKVPFQKRVSFVFVSLFAMLIAYWSASYYIGHIGQYNPMDGGDISIHHAYVGFCMAGALGAGILAFDLSRRVARLSFLKIILVIVVGAVAAIPLARFFVDSSNLQVDWTILINNPFMFWQLTVGGVLGYFLHRRMKITSSNTTNSSLHPLKFDEAVKVAK